MYIALCSTSFWPPSNYQVEEVEINGGDKNFMLWKIHGFKNKTELIALKRRQQNLKIVEIYLAVG
jgi:hypothetical protein